jgi:methyl-accepting chemotaxis protein
MTRAHVGDDYHDRPGVFSRAADEVLANGKATFTPIYHTPTGRPQVSYLVPLLGSDGKPVELVSLALYAVSDRVNTWLAELTPAAGYLAVLDANNRLLALSGAAPPSFQKAGTGSVQGVPVSASEQHAVLAIDGREDLVNTAPIARTGFHVWVGVPRAVVYAPLEKMRWPLLLAGLLALCVGAFGIWRISRGIVSSIAELVGGIRRVGEGVLSHRVPEGRPDELGAAAVAFNRMAARLQRDQLVEEIWRKVHHT